MKLPDGFIFSQSSLQDFVDCRRRFQLRYINRLAWPALETEPALEAERYLQQGARFHRMVQQHLLGVPAERLSNMITDDDLSRWWHNYLSFVQALRQQSAAPTEGVSEHAIFGAARGYPEISLSATLAGFRLEAKFDLVLLLPDGGTRIYDWKTSRRRPERRWLANRLQTRLYPYLLTRAGAVLNGGEDLMPEKVEMIYWFADHPGQPERIAYSAQAFRDDEAYLTDLVATIQRLGDDDFPLTTDLRRCAFCSYRSLCDRGARAGDLDEMQGEADITDEMALNLDFEQIGEIEF